MMPQFLSSKNIKITNFDEKPKFTLYDYEQSSSSLRLESDVEIDQLTEENDHNTTMGKEKKIEESMIKHDFQRAYVNQSPEISTSEIKHSRSHDYVNINGAPDALSIPDVPQRPPRVFLQRQNKLSFDAPHQETRLQPELSKSTTAISFDVSPILTNNSNVPSVVPFQSYVNDNNSGATMCTNTTKLNSNNSNETCSTGFSRVQHKFHGHHKNIAKDPYQKYQPPPLFLMQFHQDPYLLAQYPMAHQNAYNQFRSNHNGPILGKPPHGHMMDDFQSSPYPSFPPNYPFAKMQPNGFNHEADKIQKDLKDHMNPNLLYHSNFLMSENEELQKKLQEANLRLEYLEALEMHVNYLEMLFGEIVASQQRQNSIHNQLHTVSMPSIISDYKRGQKPKVPMRPNHCSRFMRNVKRFDKMNNNSKNSSRTVSLDRSSKVPSSSSFLGEFPKESSISQNDKENSSYKTESLSDVAQELKHLHDPTKYDYDENKMEKISPYLTDSEPGREAEDIGDEDDDYAMNKSLCSIINEDNSSKVNSSTLSATNMRGIESESTSSMMTIVRKYPSLIRLPRSNGTLSTACARKVQSLSTKRKIDLESRDLQVQSRSDSTDSHHTENSCEEKTTLKEKNLSITDQDFEYCKLNELEENACPEIGGNSQNGSGSYEGVTPLCTLNAQSNIAGCAYESKEKKNAHQFIDKFKSVIHRNQKNEDGKLRKTSEQAKTPPQVVKSLSLKSATPPMPRSIKNGRTYSQLTTIGFRSPPLGVGSRHNSFASEIPRLQTFQQMNNDKSKLRYITSVNQKLNSMHISGAGTLSPGLNRKNIYK